MSTEGQEHLDLEDIREILAVFSGSDLTDLDLRVGSTHLRLSRGEGRLDDASAGDAMSPEVVPVSAGSDQQHIESVAAGEPTPEVPVDAPRSDLRAITAPMVGVFYRRPSPERPPYVEVGSTVDVDTPVCTIEVMKMFKQIEAGVDGRIVDIVVADEELVQAGDSLFYVEPV